ncbi:hypothetical protein LZ30DRAFT_474892 [Colletotrichum cereale]|nr:hypothetical protein LZ30DRAFT_474892 [Colletotrichum cereale]
MPSEAQVSIPSFGSGTRAVFDCPSFSLFVIFFCSFSVLPILAVGGGWFGSHFVPSQRGCPGEGVPGHSTPLPESVILVGLARSCLVPGCSPLMTARRSDPSTAASDIRCSATLMSRTGLIMDLGGRLAGLVSGVTRSAVKEGGKHTPHTLGKNVPAGDGIEKAERKEEPGRLSRITM